MPKYEALTRYLADQRAEEPVSLTFAELGRLIGGLPPSAAGRTWWANTKDHSQSAAWLRSGRRVVELRLGDAVVFSSADGDDPGIAPIAQGRTAAAAILDGVEALGAFVAKASYSSVVEAVAAHTVFLDPGTVAQTGGHALFPVIRNPNRRGQMDRLPDGHQVLLDDNTSPTQAFQWASQRGKGRDVQYNHVWAGPQNADTYTALWNLAVTPAFLAKTTDGSNHPEVLAALRHRAYELFGHYPNGEEIPGRPAGYGRLCWPDPPGPVDNLEAVLRARLLDAPRSRPALAARQIGWLFSSWNPDTTLPDPDA